MLGLNVFPRLAIDDALSNSERYAEMFMKTLVSPLLSGVQASHFQHQGRCQFGVSVLLTALRYKTSLTRAFGSFGLWLKSTLSGSVLCIGPWSSKKEMAGVYARWIVAFMADIHALWNGAICKFPRVTMREGLFAVYAKCSISDAILPPRPNPASVVEFGNIKPETMFGIHLADSTGYIPV